MVDINELFKLSGQFDEIKRRERMLGLTNDVNSRILNHHQDLMREISRPRYLNSIMDSVSHRLTDRLQEISSLRFTDSLREITRPQFQDAVKSLASLNHRDSIQQLMSQSLMDNVRGFENKSLSSMSKIINEITRPVSALDSLNQTSRSYLKELTQSLTKPFQFAHTDLIRDLEIQTRAATLSSVEVLSKSVIKENFLLTNSGALSQISKSIFDYDRFTNDTLRKLNSDINNSTSLALKSSLILANEQILRSTTAAHTYLDFSGYDYQTDSQIVLDRIHPKTNRYRVQRQEFLQRDDIEENEDYGSLVVKSPSAISFDLLVNCLKIVSQCNETSLTTKGNSIFTLTNSLWTSSFGLLQTVPTNKEKFAEIIDYLYFILIEGAGKDKLRFINYEDGKNFGYFLKIEPEVEVIWKIKHLRNKWLRHDIEHGDESAIRKDYRIRKETLEWFGMGKMPNSRDDFVYLYNNLIFKVEEF